MLPALLTTTIFQQSIQGGVEEDTPVSSIIEPSSCTQLSSTDAALFTYYIASTALSISTPSTADLWQQHVPKLSHQHLFLLHGILALSALHLSHLSPSHNHIITANTHQSIAMPLFRTAITNVTIQNSEAVLIFSHLLILYSFAAESSDERFLLTTPSSSPVSHLSGEEAEADLLPPWLYFLRNGCSLLCTVWDHLESSASSPLALAWDIPILHPSSPTPLLTHLLSIPLSCPHNTYSWSETEVALYTDAATDLATAFASTQLQDEFTTWDALRVWPMHLSVPFLSLLQKYHPGALVLLAHYCILLKKIEGHWYFEGRATRLLGMILRHLGRGWWRFIRWPLEEIGGDEAEREDGGLDWHAVRMV